MKKIAFLWWFGKASEIVDNWRDGLRGALEELEKTCIVDIYLGEIEPPDNYDAIIFWSDSSCSFFSCLDNFGGKRGICLTTWPHNIENLKKLDVVYCESTPIYEEVRRHGIHAVMAFGTDTDFFSPDESFIKDIEYFYPGTFSPWKRQSALSYLGPRLTCVGTIQPDGQEEYEKCISAGVNVEIGYFPAEKIRDMYRRTRKIIIPAVHGSERTVLEAMACNIVPEVTDHTNRAHIYIEEFKNSRYSTPREFVLQNYSHVLYAKQLWRGLSL